MCEQSNTYTTTTRPRLLPMILVMVLSWLSFNFALAQTDVSVHPLEQSKTRFVNVDVFIYGAGSISSNYIHTANANYYSNNANSKLYNIPLNVGVSTDVFLLNLLRFCASFGYIHERYAYEKGIANNTEIIAHWLTADLNFSLSYLSIGINTDVFLNSQIKNDNHFSYNGIFSSCFNPMTFSVYGGVIYRFAGIKVEARGGYRLIPQINPNQLAYYNFQSSSISGFYWELRLSFRCFTTGRRSKSLDISKPIFD